MERLLAATIDAAVDGGAVKPSSFERVRPILARSLPVVGAPFRYSSRNRPMKLSANAFCCGLPGAM
jgi:hypothetical protein